jgi:phosphatidylserine/phosphatidylglycerophosphate/cardiolipin synthase-like enzyme
MIRDENRTAKTSKKGWLAAATGFVATLILAIVYLLGSGEAAEPAEYVPGLPAEGAASPGVEESLLVFFTDPVYPDNVADHQGGLDEMLAADIIRAQSTVDVAAYDFDLETVTDALLEAHAYGVLVRLVTDSDNAQEPVVRQLRSAGIKVVEDQRGAYMHNKFVVIDERIVWTGSWNLTESGTYRNNNNAVRIVSDQLAENYSVEFEEMFEDRSFGAGSPANTTHPQVLVDDGKKDGGIRVESYFAPEDRVGEKLLALVKEAEDSVRFLAFSFTDDELGKAMIAQNEAGVTVQGVFEGRNADPVYSEFGRMYDAQPRMDVRLDGNTYMMHHKVIILDNEKVVLGSFNFSESADTMNDENVLVIHDREIASLFRAEFKRIYREATEARE